MVNDQSAKESVSMGPNRIAEALLTRMSTPPARAAASCTQRRAPSSVARSTGATASIRPPSARASSTVSAEVSGLRSQPTTWAPSRAHSSAAARPIPPPVPEISARFPSRRPIRGSFIHPSAGLIRPASILFFILCKSLSQSESIVNKTQSRGAQMSTTGPGRRILGLGCGRPHGSAEILLKAALRAAEDQGAEVELVRLDELRLPSGTAEAAEPDDAWWLWERLVECDGLIVSTPIISRTVAARLKLLVDRLLGPNADAAIIDGLLALRRQGRSRPFRSASMSGC